MGGRVVGRIHAHGAKFQDPEGAPVGADALLGEENRAVVLQLHRG